MCHNSVRVSERTLIHQITKVAAMTFITMYSGIYPAGFISLSDHWLWEARYKTSGDYSKFFLGFSYNLIYENSPK